MEDIKSIFLISFHKTYQEEEIKPQVKQRGNKKVWVGNNKKETNKEKKSIKVKDTSPGN